MPLATMHVQNITIIIYQYYDRSPHPISVVLFSCRNLETISIGTCRLHGSPKHGGSTNVSPHHRLHHHHLYLHRSHSRVQNLDLMDDLPLPFQTDPHHLGLLVQESPMLSPNPPPSVVESNGQNLVSNATTATLASGQPSTATNHPNPSSCNTISNFSNTTTATNTTNVIINNIKTNTTTIGTTNLDSGIVQPTATTTTTATEGGGDDAATDTLKSKSERKESNVRNRWHTCPELHKAMDGVTYIADHTKKEEESTRVSSVGLYCFFSLGIGKKLLKVLRVI
jgi:nicotinic acetylcholine receptor